MNIKSNLTLPGLLLALNILVLNTASFAKDVHKESILQSSYNAIPLPDNVVEMSSIRGLKFLKKDLDRNTVQLLMHFVTQQTTTYCGVASIVMVLNSSSLPKPADSLHQPYHYFSQEDFFKPNVTQIISRNAVKKNGMSLAQLEKIVQSFGLPATRYYANELRLPKFREILLKALSEENFVIVNFLRTGLKQQGGGHHSPIAAYDKQSDRFLVLDVARYKYPAYWVKTSDLYYATKTMDGSKSRGFVVISPEK